MAPTPTQLLEKRPIRDSEHGGRADPSNEPQDGALHWDVELVRAALSVLPIEVIDDLR
jgi:hypothetical protein